MQVRIAGIVISIVSLVVLFFKPFEPTINTLIVYLLIIAAAVVMMIGQAIVYTYAPKEEIKNTEQRHEALYDLITTGVLVTLFAALYVIPYIVKHF